MMYEINEYLYSLPPYIHYIVFAIIVGMYAHLWIGYTKVKSRLKPHVRKYFIIRFLVMLCYVFLKADDEVYGLFDLFLPIYILSYIDGLVIIKSFRLHRCDDFKSAVKHIIKFNTLKKKNENSTVI